MSQAGTAEARDDDAADVAALVRQRMRHYPPQTSERARQHDEMRAAFIEFSSRVVAAVPPASARERAVLLSKLEEALYAANAGIARAPYDGTERYSPEALARLGAEQQ